MHWYFTMRTKPTSAQENTWIFYNIIVVKYQLMVMKYLKLTHNQQANLQIPIHLLRSGYIEPKLQFILTNYADQTISQLYYNNYQRSQQCHNTSKKKHEFSTVIM